ncbi:hypothetical protein EON79_12950 [bacterium]|nr:MAG: hypothetical protein EON79_12950 [bacterium]
MNGSGEIQPISLEMSEAPDKMDHYLEDRKISPEARASLKASIAEATAYRFHPDGNGGLVFYKSMGLRDYAFGGQVAGPYSLHRVDRSGKVTDLTPASWTSIDIFPGGQAKDKVYFLGNREPHVVWEAIFPIRAPIGSRVPNKSASHLAVSADGRWLAWNHIKTIEDLNLS